MYNMIILLNSTQPQSFMLTLKLKFPLIYLLRTRVCVCTLHSSAERLWYRGHPDMEKCLSCFPVRWPERKRMERWDRTPRVGLQEQDIWSKEKPFSICALTHWVASRCWALHVEVVALVEAPSFWPVGKVMGCGLLEWQLFGQSLILLLWNYDIIARRHKVIAGARNFNIRLRGWGVTCRSARRGLVPFCPLLQVCRSSQDKDN